MNFLLILILVIIYGNGELEDVAFSDEGAKPKKRKSRWGGEEGTSTSINAATPATGITASTSSNDLSAVVTAGTGAVESNDAAANEETGEGKKTRKSRLTTASTAPGATSAGGADENNGTIISRIGPAELDISNATATD